jgi:hypothetical protein
MISGLTGSNTTPQAVVRFWPAVGLALPAPFALQAVGDKQEGCVGGYAPRCAPVESGNDHVMSARIAAEPEPLP